MARRAKSSHPVYNMTDKEYKKLMEEHRARVRRRAEEEFDKALVKVAHSNAPVRQMAADTGLTAQTLNRYLNHGWGARGPYFTTYLAIKSRGHGQ